MHDGGTRQSFSTGAVRVRNEVLQNLLATEQLTKGTNPETGRGTCFFVKGKVPRTVNDPSTTC